MFLVNKKSKMSTSVTYNLYYSLEKFQNLDNQ